MQITKLLGNKREYYSVDFLVEVGLELDIKGGWGFQQNPRSISHRFAFQHHHKYLDYEEII